MRTDISIPMGKPFWDIEEYQSMIKHGILKNNHIQKMDYENIIKNHFGMKYCIFTDLGRQAITLALIAFGIKKEQEVIVPSFVCQNVIAPIVLLGAKPRYVDFDEDYNISPESVNRNICDKTAVIIVPHLFGKVAQIQEIETIARSRGIYVIDDAAQSIGAKINDRYVGTFGDAGILSFGPFKSINATRGGALVFNNDIFYEKIKKIKMLNPHGIPFARGIKSIIKFEMRKYSLPILSKISQPNHNPGTRTTQSLSEFIKFFTSESRPCHIDLMDLAMAKSQLFKMPFIIKKRKQLGKKLTALLSDLSWFKTNNQTIGENIFVKYIIDLEKLLQKSSMGDSIISKVIGFLNSKGIETHRAYSPMHQNTQLSFAARPYLENTECKAPCLICLPINYDMNFSDVDFIASCIRSLPEII